ncbi:MAG: hypothetical protein RW306_16290 [Geobacteraceae bacterium]|nr:hypothetical protein [Geobacteraceae bacterium]
MPFKKFFVSSETNTGENINHQINPRFPACVAMQASDTPTLYSRSTEAVPAAGNCVIPANPVTKHFHDTLPVSASYYRKPHGVSRCCSAITRDNQNPVLTTHLFEPFPAGRGEHRP